MKSVKRERQDDSKWKTMLEGGRSQQKGERGIFFSSIWTKLRKRFFSLLTLKCPFNSSQWFSEDREIQKKSLSLQTFLSYGINAIVVKTDCKCYLKTKYVLNFFIEFSLLQLYSYSVFQGVSKAKSANGGSILSLSQFLILPQLPQKWSLLQKWSKSTQK
jgi:hypothetical protein